MEAAAEEASAGAAGDSTTATFRCHFDMDDRELMREGSAVAPLVVNLIDGFMSFDAQEVSCHPSCDLLLELASFFVLC